MARFLALFALAACAVPSPDDSEPPGPEQPGTSVATYGNRSLPGRILVNKGAQVGTAFRAGAFDLTTAKRTIAPSSSDPDRDRWSAGLTLAVRARESGGALVADLFSVRDFSSVRAGVRLPSEATLPRPSPDGKHLLAFVGDTLTVFDASDGREVETVPQFSGYSVLGDPATWMPDGSYVFLAGRTLYRTRPGAAEVTTIGDLALPGPTPASVLNNDLVASPDGQLLAISWRDIESEDADLWVVRTDGSGLRRLTRPPAATPALDFTHASPTFSPDSKWIAAVLYMSGSSSTPVIPDEPFLGDRITGTTGCIDQVFVAPVDGAIVELDWPRFDAELGLKVAAATGAGGQWLSTCSGEIAWLPSSS